MTLKSNDVKKAKHKKVEWKTDPEITMVIDKSTKIKRGCKGGRPRKYYQVPVEEYEEMKKKIETPPARISPLENPIPDKIFYTVHELEQQIEAVKEVLLWTIITLTGEGLRPPNIERAFQTLGISKQFHEKIR